MLREMNRRRQKGQSTLEYAILIIIIIGALLSIQIYIKRGIMGRLKQATDDIGDQFDPGHTKYLSTTITDSSTKEEFTDGVTNSTLTSQEETTVDVDSNIVDINDTYWGTD